MTLPTFIIAGAQKCGTTALHNYLRLHPDIYIPRKPQELHYFDIADNYKRGLKWYESHFEQAAPHQQVGQTSPLYIYQPQVPQRISSLLPDVRLIFILRNPIDRAYSHYWHSVKKGYETLSFEAAVAQEPKRLKQDFRARRHFSYLDRGFYFMQLSRFLEYFDRSQILVVLTENLGHTPIQVVESCFSFLGVEPRAELVEAPIFKTRINQSKLPRSRRFQQFVGLWRDRFPRVARLTDLVNLRVASYPEMARETRRKLRDVYENDLNGLASQFELDLSPWQK